MFQKDDSDIVGAAVGGGVGGGISLAGIIGLICYYRKKLKEWKDEFNLCKDEPKDWSTGKSSQKGSKYVSTIESPQKGSK